MDSSVKRNFDFNIMLNMIRDDESFSYSRFGDGEWSAILQNRKPGAFNCDHHHFFPDMGARLKSIVESRPAYFIGMQNLAKEQNQDSLEFQRLYKMNEWSDNEVFTRASIRGELDTFFGLLKIVSAIGHKIIMVGNASLRELNRFPVNKFIEVPEKDCWLEYENIKPRVQWAIDAEANPIVLYCASMMSNVLVDDMEKLYEGKIIQLDCGSVFDPYVGRNTRSYHKKLKL